MLEKAEETHYLWCGAYGPSTLLCLNHPEFVFTRLSMLLLLAYVNDADPNFPIFGNLEFK